MRSHFLLSSPCRTKVPLCLSWSSFMYWKASRSPLLNVFHGPNACDLFWARSKWDVIHRVSVTECAVQIDPNTKKGGKKEIKTAALLVIGCSPLQFSKMRSFEPGFPTHADPRSQIQPSTHYVICWPSPCWTQRCPYIIYKVVVLSKKSQTFPREKHLQHFVRLVGAHQP